MPLAKKIQSHLYLILHKASLNTNHGFVSLIVEYNNQYSQDTPTLADFQYSTDDGASWQDCTQPAGKEFFASANSASMGTAYLFWDAATDLGCCSAHNDVQIRISLNDDQSVESDYVTNTLDIDFRTTSITDEKFTRPKQYDDEWDFEFTSPAYLRFTKLHFKIEIAQDQDFNTIVVTKDSSSVTTNWAYDTLALPTAGIDGRNTHTIIYDGNIGASLSNDTDYYYRVTVLPTCPDYTATTISKGTYQTDHTHGLAFKPWAWLSRSSDSQLLTPANYSFKYLTTDKLRLDFNENIPSGLDLFIWKTQPQSTSANGVSSMTVQHNLDYYPFVWFANSDDEILTPANYTVKYEDAGGNPSANHFTVEFNETVSNITIYYDLGNTTAPASHSVSAGETSTTISHNTGGHPFIWGKDNNNRLITPLNYPILYTNLKDATINFNETLANPLTFYYRG